jgi:hypothetical protein
MVASLERGENPTHEHRIKLGMVGLIIRWIARVWSIASVGFVLLILVAELLFPHAEASFTFRDLVLLLFFPFGTCVGMIVGWRWEGLGGAITVGSLIAFYAALRIMDGRFPGGPYFALVAAPGFLFLLSWATTVAWKRKSRS